MLSTATPSRKSTRWRSVSLVPTWPSVAADGGMDSSNRIHQRRGVRLSQTRHWPLCYRLDPFNARSIGSIARFRRVAPRTIAMSLLCGQDFDLSRCHFSLGSSTPRTFRQIILLLAINQVMYRAIALMRLYQITWIPELPRLLYWHTSTRVSPDHLRRCFRRRKRN